MELDRQASHCWTGESGVTRTQGNIDWGKLEVLPSLEVEGEEEVEERKNNI